MALTAFTTTLPPVQPYHYSGVVCYPRSLLRNFAVAWYKIGFLVCFPPNGILETEEPSILSDVVTSSQKCRISFSCKGVYHACDKKYLRMPRGASLIS